jgi:hypothetical protein
VSNKSDYLLRLQSFLKQLYNCGATWRESVAIQQTYHGKVIWKGEVEIFDLSGHPKAVRAYGWSRPEGNANQGEHFVTVLELPPVDSPKMAVQISIADDIDASKVTINN